METERTILLADMDSFFASCHQAQDPSLRGRPVIVAGDPSLRRGIVLAASYEAKAAGVRTAMLNREARRLCPEALFIHPEFELYTAVSARIRGIMRDFTPLVQPFSIDEAFLDVTGCLRLFGDGGDGLTIARLLQERIRLEAGVPCSVGAGPNKLLAKMAAGLQKPFGLARLGEGDVAERLWPLPVRALFGVGPRMERHLTSLGIRRIGDLARFPLESLKRRFGAYGEFLWNAAHGRGGGPVDPEARLRPKHIGHQLTLPRDLQDREAVGRVLLELADAVARRARMKQVKGRQIGLTLRGPALENVYRSRSLPYLTDRSEDIRRVSMSLFDAAWPPGKPVRLLGVSLGGLVRGAPEQLRLFEGGAGRGALLQAMDDLARRHGPKAVVRAASLTEQSMHASRRREAAPGRASARPESRRRNLMEGSCR